MPAILGLKCIYDTKNQSWAIELALEGADETARFAVADADDVETFIETYEESTSADFDPESGEVTFAFEYAFADEVEDEDEDEEDDDEDEDEEEDDEESSGASRKRS